MHDTKPEVFDILFLVLFWVHDLQLLILIHDF